MPQGAFRAIVNPSPAGKEEDVENVPSSFVGEQVLPSGKKKHSPDTAEDAEIPQPGVRMQLTQQS